MKQTFAVVLLFSIGLGAGACGGKKDSTTPANRPPAIEKDGATGGASYGGHKAQGTPKASP